MNTREGTRERRINAIRKYLEQELKKEKSVSYAHLLAWTCFNLGVSRRTAMDYLDPMFELGMYKLKGDEITK